jgi:hypothetical protein
MSIMGETPRRNCADITQSENADSQGGLSRVAIRPRNCDLLMRSFGSTARRAVIP